MAATRRPRREREVVFGFDSFLDVVTNVVGIIIRFILVVWVGARSYQSIRTAAVPEEPPPAAASLPLPVITDPLEAELEQRRQELARLREQLLEELRRLQLGQEQQRQAEVRLAALTEQRRALQARRADLDTQARASLGPLGPLADASLADLRQRQQKLLEAIQSLEKQPVPKKLLRYRTPVSRPVNTEEYRFECRHGRVAFIDIPAMVLDIERDLESKIEMLQHTWQVTDVTRPAGAFRLRYTLERQRDALDAILGSALPDSRSGFRVGLSWQVEPIALVRGETAAEALQERSEFRRVVDVLDRQAVVTFWVYPDSFDLYRQLRDYLYGRELTVAGRPLPADMPITFSWRGSRSRGQ